MYRATVISLFVLLASLASAKSVVSVQPPIDRLYQHIWRDELEGLYGDLLLGRRNPSYENAPSDVREFFVAISFEMKSPNFRGPLQAKFVVAAGSPFSDQLRQFGPSRLAELDLTIEQHTTYFPANDPVLKQLSFQSGKLKEADCPALREVFDGFADYTPAVEPDMDGTSPVAMAGPWYYLRSLGTAGRLSVQLDGAAPDSKWIRASLEKIEACVDLSRSNDKQ